MNCDDAISDTGKKKFWGISKREVQVLKIMAVVAIGFVFGFIANSYATYELNREKEIKLWNKQFESLLKKLKNTNLPENCVKK